MLSSLNVETCHVSLLSCHSYLHPPNQHFHTQKWQKWSWKQSEAYVLNFTINVQNRRETLIIACLSTGAQCKACCHLLIFLRLLIDQCSCQYYIFSNLHTRQEKTKTYKPLMESRSQRTKVLKLSRISCVPFYTGWWLWCTSLSFATQQERFNCFTVFILTLLERKIKIFMLSDFYTFLWM